MSLSAQDVNNAIQSLRTTIDKLITRFEQRPNQRFDGRKRLQYTLNHLQYCLKRIPQHQTSLQCGLTFLKQHYWPQVRQSIQACHTSKDRIATLLQHVFELLLRLHDGLILIISGECRHPADIARKKKFPTRLTKQGTRTDGYTQLYNASLTYSGAGWDEIDQHLIPTLLECVKPIISSSKHDQLQEYLLEEHSAVAFVLQRIEAQSHELQAEFRSLNQLLTLPQIRLSLSLLDKMEQLTVQTSDGWVCEFQRRAKEFVIQDPAGVLPKFTCPLQWKDIMTLPVQQVQRRPQPVASRRRVLLDSDDDEEPTETERSRQPLVTNSTTAPTTTTGLVTKIVETAKTEQMESTTDIKQQLGINVAALASARDVLEAEEAQAAIAANLVDDAPVNNECGPDEEPLEVAERKYRHLSRRLKQVLRNSSADENDVWNTRECTREAAMEAGNSCLEAILEDSSTSEQATREQVLERGILYFEKAIDLVNAQQMSLRQLPRDHQSSSWLRRNLSLLLGQAHVNAAIVRIELRRWKNQPDRKFLSREARRELDLALDCVKELLVMAEKDGDNESTLDILKAKELEALVLRWKGKLLWSLGKETAARESFEAALCVANDTRFDSLSDFGLVEAKLKVMAQGYHSALSASDIAVETLDLASVETIRLAPGRFDDLFAVYQRWVERACSISDNIQEVAKTAQESIECLLVLDEEEILSQEELQGHMTKIQSWWHKKKRSSMQSISNIERPPLIPRNDLFNESSRDALEPTGFCTLDAIARRRRKSKATSITKPTGPMNAKQATRHESSQPKRQYRKWGDELLPTCIDAQGRSIPMIPYPAIAPPMPDEIRAILEANRRS